MNYLFNSYLNKNRTKEILNLRPGDEGFSLVELVVVIAVLAILSAVAIPAFQGVQARAKVSAVKNGLTNGIKECIVSAALDPGNSAATLFSVSQAYAGQYSGYTVSQNTSVGDSCYAAQATTTDAGLANFYQSYNANTGVATKACSAGIGCDAGKW